MIKTYTKQQFKDKYDEPGVVTYYPIDLIRGEWIMVFDADGLWKPAIFIGIVKGHIDEITDIYAIVNYEIIVRIFKEWAVIEG